MRSERGGGEAVAAGLPVHHGGVGARSAFPWLTSTPAGAARRGTQGAVGGGPGARLAPPPGLRSRPSVLLPTGPARRSAGRYALRSLQAWAQARLAGDRGSRLDSVLALAQRRRLGSQRQP